jgi:hypothetical protein
MFDKTDERLESWLKSITQDLEVFFAVPTKDLKKQGVYIYLLDLLPNPSGRGVRRPPLQITLRYLIFPQSEDPKENHGILGNLLISAMESTEFEVEKNPILPEIWQAFGLPPQPAFILRVPFTLEREEKLAPPVRFPAVINQTTLESFQGRILAGRIPIVNAKVEIPALKTTATTNSDGFFRFASIPSEPKNKNLIIRAKGREFSVFTDQIDRSGDLFDIQIKLEE